MEYKEKLRDPRWQKRRLEILDRDGWKCTECGNSKLELHVHHLKYSGDPWEVGDEDLKTLCKECHFWVHVEINFVLWKEFLRKKYLG
ncbi:HNH endonuclease [Candidatus Pacearchaeota archaeon]|nr:HNH endonuclease [Candidatus Pacearchaeota archaeon]